MRNVTVRREKSFAGCLTKVRVCVEDHEAGRVGRLVINGTPCRKLGTLKNGEEKTFSVGERAARLFVIADSLSKGFCSEFYELPEGAEDVRLSGRCRFNPADGNAFRFDGEVSRAAQENRKNSVRRGVAVLVAACVIGAATGVVGMSRLIRSVAQTVQAVRNVRPAIVMSETDGPKTQADGEAPAKAAESPAAVPGPAAAAAAGETAAPAPEAAEPETQASRADREGMQTFRTDGMRLTLSDDFSEAPIKGYTAAYGTEDTAVFVLKEPFSLLEGAEEYTIGQYRDILIEANGLTGVDRIDQEGLTGFSYPFSDPETGEALCFFDYVYKSDDAFWLLQFVVPGAEADGRADEIAGWARTVSFDG